MYHRVYSLATPLTWTHLHSSRISHHIHQPTLRHVYPIPLQYAGISPLDLTKVRLQASGDRRMVESIKRTVRTAGIRGLFDGISGTWMRQMSYSLCRFWAYDESKKIVGATCQLIIIGYLLNFYWLSPSPFSSSFFVNVDYFVDWGSGFGILVVRVTRSERCTGV